MTYNFQKFAQRLKALHSRLKGYQQGHQPYYGISGEILLTESSTFDKLDSPSQMIQIWTQHFFFEELNSEATYLNNILDPIFSKEI